MRIAAVDFHLAAQPADLVVDRAIEQVRLAALHHIEQAIAIGKGKVGFYDMDAGDAAQPTALKIFDSRFSCIQCGHEHRVPEPNLFSFNSPIGACPRCDGLGSISFFDPKRVVGFPQLSLASGAIRGWDRRNQFYFQMLQGLAAHYGFDLETPFAELPEEARHAVVYGSGEEVIEFDYVSEKGVLQKRKHTFEGVLPNFRRRYRETESGAVREELAKYMSRRDCPDCHGARLRREARFVKVGPGKQSRAIYEVSRLPLHETANFFDSLQLDGSKRQIAERIVWEIRNRVGFLNNVGLDYLSLDRSAETLSGGEAQRIRLASQIGSGLTGVMYVLDEPSIGLHQRDNDRLLETLKHLRDLGNTVIVVEHDEDAIMSADYVVDLGPAAGVHGGEVVAHGKPAPDLYLHAADQLGTRALHCWAFED